jgi:hypothetical protein
MRKVADISSETSSNLRQCALRNFPDDTMNINYIVLLIFLDAFGKGNRLKTLVKIYEDVVNLSVTVSVKVLKKNVLDSS